MRLLKDLLLTDLKQARNRLMILWKSSENLAKEGIISDEAARLVGDAWSYLCSAIDEIEENGGDER